MLFVFEDSFKESFQIVILITTNDDRNFKNKLK